MATKNIVLGGGRGMIGRAILGKLHKKGYKVTVVTRYPKEVRSVPAISWADIKASGLPEDTHAVINVAGKDVLKPNFWTEKAKEEVVTSRVGTTKLLADAVANTKAVAFVTISGANYYEPKSDYEYSEKDICKPFDFMSDLCHAWEEAAKITGNTNIRQIVIRSGVVLHTFARIAVGMTAGRLTRIGVVFGDGKQYLPWIHRDDLTNLFIYSIENENVATGVLNGVAPQAVTYKDIVRFYAEQKNFNYLHTTYVQPFIVNLIFKPDRAVMLLDGAKIAPKRILHLGFNYKYPTIKSAFDTFY